VAVVANFANERVFYLAAVLLFAVSLPFSLLSMRRIQRNVALLAGGST
jgi:hypothetical protein